MTIAQQLITADQFVDMEFDGPAELVDGEVVYLPRSISRGTDVGRGSQMPLNFHGCVTAAIVGLLYSWNRKHRLGFVLSNDSWVQTKSDPDSVRGPDVIFIRRDQLPSDKLEQGILKYPPALVVEVL